MVTWNAFQIQTVDATEDSIRKIKVKNMYTKNVKNNYDEATAKKYLSEEKPIINVSSEIEIQRKWNGEKYTDETAAYRIYVVQEGVNPFAVKFEKKPKLPPFLSEVTLEKLEAIEIRSKVYFRAESIEEKK